MKTNCQHCNQPVLLLRTIKNQPITLNPHSTRAGTILINDDTALVYRSVESIAVARLEEPRYLPHDCPNAPERP